jgi:hypothetical protein
MALVTLTVDRLGILNAFVLDSGLHKGWRGPEPIGSMSLVPGSPVAVVK